MPLALRFRRHRLAVVNLAARGIEPVGMGRDVAEKVQRMGGVSRVTRRRFDRAVVMTPAMVTEIERDVRRDLDGPVALARDLDEFVV